MRKTIFKTALVIILLFSTSLMVAQEADSEGCKDHQFFNRLEKYYISDCKTNYNEHEFMMGQDKTEVLEGMLTEIIYSYDGPFGPNLPSKLQVVKNYENAILKMGGKKIYSRTVDDGDWTGATFHLQKDGKKYWLGIYEMINNPVDQYSFILLSKEGMKQEIVANEMFEKINSGNALTLYINFDTGKSSIKSDSQSLIDELQKMLKDNSDLKVTIEGHTDNAGNKPSNQALSEQRAASLKWALVDKGIAPERIKTVGYGQDKPIADNATEDGKSKNRRVEIKKI